jgi:hypothetical protein
MGRAALPEIAGGLKEGVILNVGVVSFLKNWVLCGHVTPPFQKSCVQAWDWWTGALDWWTSWTVDWTGELDWWTGLDWWTRPWTGGLDCGLDWWTGELDW